MIHFFSILIPLITFRMFLVMISSSPTIGLMIFVLIFMIHLRAPLQGIMLMIIKRISTNSSSSPGGSPWAAPARTCSRTRPSPPLALSQMYQTSVQSLTSPHLTVGADISRTSPSWPTRSCCTARGPFWRQLVTSVSCSVASLDSDSSWSLDKTNTRS